MDAIALEVVGVSAGMALGRQDIDDERQSFSGKEECK